MVRWVVWGIVWGALAAAQAADHVQPLSVAADYLNLPVKHGAPKRWVDLEVAGRRVRQFDIELADGAPDYWVFLALRPFRGQSATLTIHDLPDDSEAPVRIHQSDRPRGAASFYREPLRQQFHFSSRRGWNNDSNGMVYVAGEYHLFYQHNPYGWSWGNMTWGHAVSTDMVHWHELDDALHPDGLGTVFSGSAVIDGRNTAGFQTGTEPAMVCVYTAAGGHGSWSQGQPFTQALAYSNDRGRTWTKYADNPVVGHIRGGNRDPKVFWHAPTGRWVMVLYADQHDFDILTSPDLKHWEPQSRLHCFHECPELFPLALDDDATRTRWVLYGASGDYHVGDFDGRTFRPDGEAIGFSHGNCFYASQTFNNMPDTRRVQIAWGRIKTPGMPFNQCMLFPVELSLRSTPAGPRLRAVPIRELASLHGRRFVYQNLSLTDALTLDGPSGGLYRIRVRLRPQGATACGLVVCGAAITFEPKANRLVCGDKKASLTPRDGRIDLEVLVDRTSLEIFADDGLVYMPMGGVLTPGDQTIQIFGRDGSVFVESLEIHELDSIWSGGSRR